MVKIGVAGGAAFAGEVEAAAFVPGVRGREADGTDAGVADREVDDGVELEAVLE